MLFFLFLLEKRHSHIVFNTDLVTFTFNRSPIRHSLTSEHFMTHITLPYVHGHLGYMKPMLHVSYYIIPSVKPHPHKHSEYVPRTA